MVTLSLMMHLNDSFNMSYILWLNLFNMYPLVCNRISYFWICKVLFPVITPQSEFNFRSTSTLKSFSWSIWNPFVFLEYSILISKWFLGAISSAKNKNLHFRQFFVQLVWNKFRNFRGHQSEKLNQRVLNLLVFHFLNSIFFSE